MKATNHKLILNQYEQTEKQKEFEARLAKLENWIDFAHNRINLLQVQKVKEAKIMEIGEYAKA